MKQLLLVRQSLRLFEVMKLLVRQSLRLFEVIKLRAGQCRRLLAVKQLLLARQDDCLAMWEAFCEAALTQWCLQPLDQGRTEQVQGRGVHVCLCQALACSL